MNPGTDETDGEQHPRPLPGESMLRASGAVPQRANVRNQAHPDGQKDDCRGGEQNGAEFPHRLTNQELNLYYRRWPFCRLMV
jgi:hypothetical protein